jgi:hypothetical protein
VAISYLKGPNYIDFDCSYLIIRVMSLFITGC